MTRARIIHAFGLAALAAANAAAVAQTPRFSERLTVREREVLVDLPDNLQGKSLKPADFQVLAGGQPREVVRAEPVSAAGEPPWTIVVYVDRALASPGTVFYSSLALSHRAAALARLGTVQVVVADSDPRQALAPSRETRRLERTLTDLSAIARVERDQQDRRLAPPGGPDAPRLRRQLDKLLAFLAARTPAGPHAVLLVADGLDLPAEQIAALDRGSGGAPRTAAAALQRAARLLAAYGWVAIPVPLRKEGAGLQASSTRSDLDTFREESPRTAALRALARPTAGTVAGFEVQLDEILSALQRRWRLWLAEPDAPVDGKLQALAVGLPGRRESVRAPEWLRSSTPEEIAEARLENLLAAKPGDGGLPLAASVVATAAGPELRLELPALQLPDGAPPGPLRLSYGWSGAEGATGIRHRTLPAGDLAKGWRFTEALAPPAGAWRLAVIVEALGPERWGGAVLRVDEGASGISQPATWRSAATSRTARSASPSTCGEKGF